MRDAYSADRILTGVPLSVLFFFHRAVPGEPAKGRVIGELDGLFGERVDCHLPGAPALPHYAYIDLVFAAREVPRRRVWNSNRPSRLARGHMYARSRTHV